MERTREDHALDLFEKAIAMVQGKDRSKVILQAHWMGKGLVVYVFNKNAHLGAVALGEYDPSTTRTSTLTRLGHKDDVVAQKAAYTIGKAIRRPVCVMAGIHVDNITQSEIIETVESAEKLVEQLLKSPMVTSSTDDISQLNI
jgi:hypothetical protein